MGRLVRDIFSVRVDVLAQAVQSMKDDKAKGEEIHDQEKKNFIINILGIVFAVLPFAGEILGPAGEAFALIGRIAGIIGDAGSQALNIYSIIQDPLTAPLVLIGAVVGLVPLKIERSGKGFESTLKESKDTMDAGNMLGKYCKVARENDALIARVIQAFLN